MPVVINLKRKIREKKRGRRCVNQTTSQDLGNRTGVMMRFKIDTITVSKLTTTAANDK